MILLFDHIRVRPLYLWTSLFTFKLVVMFIINHYRTQIFEKCIIICRMHEYTFIYREFIKLLEQFTKSEIRHIRDYMGETMNVAWEYHDYYRGCQYIIPFESHKCSMWFKCMQCERFQCFPVYVDYLANITYLMNGHIMLHLLFDMYKKISWWCKSKILFTGWIMGYNIWSIWDTGRLWYCYVEDIWC